ncbi:MAG TPA: adenylate/guanylate cyclase domain-containing protein [Oligoflexus sp.]|uniref:adenylate/guanylate cyclase domain-containing protein n=1 Tax=Oligoflexus sp. TaxID=1971216 RepID=UPI002D7F86A5|nr:adenylate/guanylate cyclase domain-containing protein [Oligoflexus sp.]HET9240402.1 adenylate/guanylate cyclase domain-containing protein [Oligoflexus sp.]
MRSKRVPGYVTLFAMGLILSLYALGVLSSLDDKSVRPLEFRLRSFLQKSPTLDPRLKIYSYDDSTLRFTKKPDLDFELWLKLLKTISDAGPRRIMIDKIFAVVDSVTPLDALKPEFEKIKADVVTAVYAGSNVIKFKEPLPTDFKGFALSQWTGRTLGADELSWMQLQPGYVYGPDPELWEGFHSFGHILYPRQGMVNLFHRYEPAHAVPHWSLLAADTIKLDEEGPSINGQPVPHIQGQVAVNMVDVAVLERNIYSLASVIHRSREGLSMSGRIKPDQLVILLPAMFTGNTDRVETPLGSVPGSYVVLSMINSVLTGQWIHTVPMSPWEIIIFAAMGWLVTLRFHAVATPLFLLAALAFTGISGVLAFVYASWQLPWLSAGLALGTSGLLNLLWIAMVRVREAQRITRAVSGLVPQDHIEALLKGEKSLEFEPEGHVVSIMFVDIVGFSLTTKKLSASETFLQLKALLADITDIVHQHQGTIDKTLGDGLLCFFGYNILGQPTQHHADQAVRCAIQIQKKIFQHSLEASEAGKALYPLRIGVNTASVFIGNIGNRQRFDFTMIGDGVNFAARLETACAPFKIMIGPSTKAQLMEISPDHPSMRKRHVMVKHTSELLEAWEVDPFHNSGEDIERIEKLYWNYAGIYQRDTRHPAASSHGIRFSSGMGHFQLLNYSVSGLGLKSDIFLAQGVVLTLNLESDDPDIQNELHQWGLSSLVVEICWGSPRVEGFEHGVRYVGLSSDQKNRIFSLFHERQKPSLHGVPSF